MNQSFSPFATSPLRRRRRSGFTLIEMMVALAIFMVLLTIIFVPLNLGVNMTHIGTARADVQQSSQQLINRIANDLRQAIHVFPNDALPGVTDRAPYTNGTAGTTVAYPYYQTDTAGGVCAVYNVPAARVGNTSRVDFIVARRNGNALVTPVVAENYLLSYYARRFDIGPTTARVAWNANPNPYNPIDNPVMLFRAQIPYRFVSGSNAGGDFIVATNTKNADLNSSRYPGTSCPTEQRRGSLWLSQNGGGEPNLEEPASQEDINTSPASHQLVTPRNMGLIAPRAGLDNTTDATQPMRNFQPATNFLCEDTNSDGKIDRVTITLVLAQYDQGGAENKAQPVRLTQVVDLPNIR